ncbi:MAG: O-antigen ligase family protein [Myxococcales bacterium]|nr:O-antigen ligase family protein [Myxococcales bacterium]
MTHTGWILRAALLAATLAWLPLPTSSFDRYHLVREALLLLACAPLCWMLRRAQLDRIDALVGALLAATIASALLASNAALTARATALTFAGAVIFWSARAHEGVDVERLWAWALGGVVLLAALALLEAHGVIYGLSWPGRAPGSLAGQRNAVAHASLLALPLALRLAEQAGVRRALALGAAALLVATVIVTRTRAAWLVLPLVVVTWIWVRADLAPTLQALAAMAVGIAAGLLPNRLAWRSATPYADTLRGLVDARHGSGLGRVTQLWRSLALVAQAPLLGVGPGNWQVHYPRVARAGDAGFAPYAAFPTARLLTNDWMALLAERGLAALIGALLLAAALARRLWRQRADDAPTTAAALALGVGAAALALLDAVLQTVTPLALVATAMGTAVPRHNPQRESAAPATRRRALAAGLCCAACIAMAAWHAASLTSLAISSSPAARLAELERAARIAPQRSALRLRLARAYVAMDRCDQALPHIGALRRQLPFHAIPQQLARACAAPR